MLLREAGHTLSELRDAGDLVEIFATFIVIRKTMSKKD